MFRRRVLPVLLMVTKLELQALETVECDALIVVAFEDTAPGVGAAAELYESKEFSGKALDLALLHRPAGLKARRLLLVGGGKPEAFTAATLRQATGTALRHMKSKSSRDIAMLLDSSFASPEHVAAAV